MPMIDPPLPEIPQRKKETIMPKYTLEQYKTLAKRFNVMTFRQKLISLQRNPEILALASDHNWWTVQVIDKDIQKHLYENECGFEIINEWGVEEIGMLINLLGIRNVGL